MLKKLFSSLQDYYSILEMKDKTISRKADKVEREVSLF